MVEKRLVVGLTGNMGSGKTVAAELFAKKGIVVIDADKIAREIVEEDSVRQKLTHHFSSEILSSSRKLNRKKLLHLIINDKQEKKWLEDYLHPLILKRVTQCVSKAKSPYVMIVAPLLLEGGYQSYVDRICLIVSLDTLKIKRIYKRDKTSSRFANQLLMSQMSTLSAIALADAIMTNNSTIKKLQEKIDQLHAVYLKLSVA